MRNDGEGLYLKRKEGRGMGVKWTLHSLVPALLIVLITALLVFAMVFISSMTTAIDRMIVMLGSGNIVLYDDYDISDWEKAEKYHVTTSSGVVFSDNGKSLVNIKGIEEGYFAGERGETLKLSTIESTARNPIIVSKTLSDRMKLDFGDTMTLMVYEEEKNRARPVLVTVTGIFDSGYAQLDRYLCYVDYSLLGGEGVWEVVLEDNDETDKRAQELWEKNIWSETYREKYSSLYLNVQQSVTILYVILASVALLAAFFSTDIVHVYLSRDWGDIAALSILGMNKKRIRRVYLILSLRAVMVASLLGTLIGLLLGSLSPLLIKAVALSNPGLVEYYISSFSVKVPWSAIILMILAMALLSLITLYISIRKEKELGRISYEA